MTMVKLVSSLLLPLLLVASLATATVATTTATTAGASSSSWMKEQMHCIGHKSLLQITLPGTHDAGAYELTAQLVPGYVPDNVEALIYAAEAKGIPLEKAITDWSEAQDQDFYQQLQGGVRYFDLRAAWDSNSSSWRSFHFEYGNKVQVMLDDIARFVREQPSEVVVLEVSHLAGYPTAENVDQLIAQIETTLGAVLFPRTQPISTSIASMVEHGWNVLVTLESDAIADHPLLWYADTLMNTYANSCDLDTMVEFDHEKAIEFAEFNQQALFKISWTLTPDAKCIVNGVRTRYPWGLIALADTANGDAFDRYISWLKAKRLRPGNILLLDHYQTSSLVRSLEHFNCL